MWQVKVDFYRSERQTLKETCFLCVQQLEFSLTSKMDDPLLGGSEEMKIVKIDNF